MVTKAEVRALALARLGPGLGDLIWDVGCGSGSVAIECARLGAAAIGIDATPDAIERTTRNARAHEVPVRVVDGRAPGALADAARPRRGVRRRRRRRARADPRRLRDPGRARGGGDAGHRRARRAGARAAVAAHGLEAEATMVQASRLRPLAGGHRLAAENPVTVVSGARRVSGVRGRRRLQPRLPGDRAARADRARARRGRRRPRAGRRAGHDRHPRARSRRWSRSRERCSGRCETYPARQLATVEVPTPSSVVASHAGTPSVAEAAALLSARHGRVVVPKQRSTHATCALAEVIA